MALRRTRLMDTTLGELRRLKEMGPESSYRAALKISAPTILEELIVFQDSLEATSSERICELVADWLWLRILGWCQKNQVSEAQQDELFKLFESVRQGLPLNDTGQGKITPRPKTN
ncbi:hypothetical protein OU800_22125 [Pseudomonas sp. GOM7]|uniref:PA2781 family protein n=1 Tax=Pseudomonas sp. GOM7 TaxID=2998079 RepID=UPI00227C8585|nr:hypothetical protein [Pseudomonas sp. GOM7]WAJ37273.1 hypothetical protein OU800_22125 [Pseudomonas sp. GOM7]